MKQSSGQLFDRRGSRKYLTQQERALIEKTVGKFPREIRTFIGVLLYTGCRISEALALNADHVDLDEGMIIFESLKKREKGIYRAVPVPPKLLDTLDLVHSIRTTREGRSRKNKVRLWKWSRTTAWRKVKDVLDAAGVEQSTKMSPKAFRHGFGVCAVTAGIPLNLVQRWLGHAQLTTTAIYADAVGAEEKKIAQRMWG